MAIQDIWSVLCHTIMPFQMKNDIDALSTRKSYRVVIIHEIYISINVETIGALTHPSFVNFADRESKDSEYKLAQSGDATCNGLDSAEVNTFSTHSLHQRHRECTIILNPFV